MNNPITCEMVALTKAEYDELIEDSHKLAHFARSLDRLSGYVSASLTLARDAHTHLMEERPEEAARTIYRIIAAQAVRRATG